MCAISSRAFWLASSLAALLSFGPVATLTAEPTPNAQASSSAQPNGKSDFDNRLKEALALAKSSLTTLEQVRTEADDWRLDSEKWQAEALELSAELMKARKDSDDLSASLKASLLQEQALSDAMDALRDEDSKLIAQARRERDEARAGALWGYAAGGVGVTVGLVWILTHSGK